jgi:protease PrsW
MAETIALLVLAIVPALLLLRYYYKQDNAKPEPIGMIVKVFFWGCLSVIPAILLELLVDKALSPFVAGMSFISIVVKSFVIAGLIEEWLKMIVVRRFIYNHSCFDEVMDGIVYTVVAGLGFATVENIFFVIDGGITVGITRAFTALPLHAIAGGIMGYYIGKAKFADNEDESKRLFRKGLLFAVLLHGFYDLIVFSGAEYELSIFAAIPLPLIFGFVRLRKLIKLALNEDKEMGRQISASEIDDNSIANDNNFIQDR